MLHLIYAGDGQQPLSSRFTITPDTMKHYAVPNRYMFHGHRRQFPPPSNRSYWLWGIVLK